MMGGFKDRVAVVTGAGGDVGGAAAILLAEQGAVVVAVDRSEPGLEALKARLPTGAVLVTIRADVSDEADVRKYVAEAAGKFGRIDLFFNNAGTEGSRTGAWCPTTELALDDFRELMAINSTGVFMGMKHVIPVMNAGGGGAIVNTSSINGLRGSRNQLGYVASKHAVRAMTVAAAKEWAHCNIRVNSIAPGTIQGRMLRDFGAIIQARVAAEPPRRQRYNPPPIERWSDPREIAEVAVFLLSDEAGHITGACYSVDGGLYAL